MATVHRATQSSDTAAAPVALKRLLPHLAEDEAFVKAFVQEAKLSALLKHPNICALHELGRVADTYFMAMEYIDGKDIRKCLRQARRAAGPPPLTMVLSVARQMCDALDYAHKLEDKKGSPLGLVHRDISPSNVLIAADGNVKIIDFGIAKATAQSATRTGTIKGKLAYMSPEALAGEPDPRSDLFSVGVVIHEMLTARPLFADKNDFKVIKKIETMMPPPPSRFNAKCPREMDAFVLKALEKKREERWLSGRAMVDALDEICNEYNLHPSPRDVMEWVVWAFSLPVPDRKTGVHEGSDSKSQVSITFLSESHSQPKGEPEQSGAVESFLSGAPGDVVENAPKSPLGPPTGLKPTEEEVLSEAMWGDGQIEPPPEVDLTSVPDVSALDADEEAATVLYDKPEGGLSVQTVAALSKLAPAPSIAGATGPANPAELGFLSFKSTDKPAKRPDSVSELFTQGGPGGQPAGPGGQPAGPGGQPAVPDSQRPPTNPTVAEPIRPQRTATPPAGVPPGRLPGPGGAPTVRGMGPNPFAEGKPRRRGFGPTPGLPYAKTDMLDLQDAGAVQDAQPVEQRGAPALDPATAPLAHAATPIAGQPPLPEAPYSLQTQPPPTPPPPTPLPYAQTPRAQSPLPRPPQPRNPFEPPAEDPDYGAPLELEQDNYGSGPNQSGAMAPNQSGAMAPNQSGVMAPNQQQLAPEDSGVGIGTFFLYLVLMAAAVGLGIVIATAL